MGRTRAFSSLRRSLLLAASAERAHLPLSATREHGEQLFDAWRRARTSRRDFVRGSAAALAVGYLLPACATEDHAGDTRIGVVGAGMAGLLCAYRLKQAGVRVKVYEASARAGGRMFTARGRLADKQIAELGGELIDTGHATMHRLAREFAITLDELTDYPDTVHADTYFFGGKSVPEALLAETFRPLAMQMQKALAAADASDEAFAKLDAMSISEWLDGVSELDPTLRAAIEAAYRGEFGREVDEQSVFNLLWLIDSKQPDPFRIFGKSDERFHTHTGSSTFPDTLAKKLTAELELEQRLVRVKKLANGKLELTLDHAGKSRAETFDKVVLALPWTVLRSVELDIGLPASKQTMIETLGYGTSSKVIGQFAGRPWLDKNMASGSAFMDLAPQCTWDTSRKQAGKSGVLTVFLGGKAGLAASQGTPDERMRALLPELDRVFPGTSKAYREGSALRMHWPSSPFQLGSYACYLPGQAAWSGTEGTKVGNVHFAGEHTSEEFQGYMEGAAESGERVSDEIFSDLGLTKRGTRRKASAT